MKHMSDRSRIDILKRGLFHSTGALLLALGLAACEQQGQDQQAQDPAVKEEAKTSTMTPEEKKMTGGAPGRVSPRTGQQATVGGAPSPAFQALDRDHDGQISAKEAKSNPELSSSLKKLDIDHDGQLNKMEFSALGKGAAAGKATAGAPSAGTKPSEAVENPNRPTD